MRLRHLVGGCILLASGSLADTAAAPARLPLSAPKPAAADLSIMTYNVKGLPWPLAFDRPAALARIGLRLRRLRAAGRQPDVVVLQEAFTTDAKAIAAESGYAHVVEGVSTRAAPTRAERATRNRFLGETQSAIVDSGLMILTDLPVLSVARTAFPPAACAGWDCLAAKGIAMATLQVPGHGPVTVATLHLNCQGASGASKSSTTAAYIWQARFLARFLAAKRQHGAPLIVAGDFNRGNRPARSAALQAAFRPLLDGSSPRRAVASSLDNVNAGTADLRFIRQRGRDLQFSFPGKEREATAIGADVPFGTEADGSMLSDHMGYTVHYRVLRRRPSVVSTARLASR